MVSTLIQPKGRMRRQAAQAILPELKVSTLIQPKGRMRHGKISGDKRLFKFQPSSSPKAGCDAPLAWANLVAVTVFQPSSSPKAGCDLEGFKVRVSVNLFQPSSSPKAGCDSCHVITTPRASRFNPHPAQRPDATLPSARHLRRAGTVSTLIQPKGRMRHEAPRWGPQPRLAQGFNPHPAQRPDATVPAAAPIVAAVQVSTLIQPKGRMRLERYQAIRDTGWVSTLIQPKGRMRLWARWLMLLASMFQPSSSPKAGCDWRVPSPRRWICSSFNPHPAQRPDATPNLAGKSLQGR